MIRTRAVLAAALAATLGGGSLASSVAPASAQAAAPSTAPSPTMPSLPAPTPEPSANAIALAREVIVASGISRSFDTIVPQFLDKIGTNLTQTRPDLIRDLNTVMEQIKPEFDKQTDALITSSARAYALRLSEKQLKDIADFFKSPSGVAYVNSQPVVMNDMFVQMQTYSQRIAGDMMTRVRQEMKKKGHDL